MLLVRQQHLCVANEAVSRKVNIHLSGVQARTVHLKITYCSFLSITWFVFAIFKIRSQDYQPPPPPQKKQNKTKQNKNKNKTKQNKNKTKKQTTKTKQNKATTKTNTQINILPSPAKNPTSQPTKPENDAKICKTSVVHSSIFTN